jgi:hypothetical protein
MHLPIIWLARRHRAWDAVHDAGFFALAAVLAALVLWRNAALLTG